MWSHALGSKKRGASNTFRSPNISSIIGGDLAIVQAVPNPPPVEPAKFISFSIPDSREIEKVERSAMNNKARKNGSAYAGVS